MMSLVETNIFEITKKQYFFKLNAYFELIFSLVIFQIIGVLFSLGGTSSQGMNFVTIVRYSSSVEMFMTISILFAIAVVVQVDKYKKVNQIIVGNKVISSLADIAFLITLCSFGAITATFSGAFLRVLFYFTGSGKNIVSEGFYISPQVLFISIISTFLYAVLFSSLGYLSGALVQFHKIFAIILPAGFIGCIFVSAVNKGFSTIPTDIFNFYCLEASIPIFALKIIITAIVFLFAAVKVTGSLEDK